MFDLWLYNNRHLFASLFVILLAIYGIGMGVFLPMVFGELFEYKHDGSHTKNRVRKIFIAILFTIFGGFIWIWSLYKSIHSYKEQKKNYMHPKFIGIFSQCTEYTCVICDAIVVYNKKILLKDDIIVYGPGKCKLNCNEIIAKEIIL